MTREMLDELLADVPRYVVPDVDKAWRTGTFRQRRAYAARAATVVVLVLVAGLGILNFDRRPTVDPADGSGVTGFPAHVPRPLGLTDLPERPGPMAGVLILDEGIAQTVLVDAAGRTWRIPDVSPWEDERPALSDDGRMLGYLRRVSESRSEYLVVDLVTGHRTTFPDVGDGRSFDDEMLTTQRYSTGGQAPGFWSPDDRWLAVHGAAYENAQPGPLLLGVDGEVRELGVGTWPMGWLAPDRLVLLDQKGRLKTVDLDGEVLDRVDLAIPTGFAVFGQWSGMLSPDGSMVAVAADENVNRDPEHRLATYDTRTGRLNDTLGWQDRLAGSCLPAWQDDRVLAWDYDDGLIDLASGETLVEASSQWGELHCGTFASDALAGPAESGPGLTEWRYWSWLWWWKQLLAGLVVGSAVLWFYVKRRRLG